MSLTRELVAEARQGRQQDFDREAADRARDRLRQLEGAVALLKGAAFDVVRHGLWLATLRHHRRLWRVKPAEPLMAAVTQAATAVSLLRYQAPPELRAAAEAMHDCLLEYMQDATGTTAPADLQRLADRIGEHNSRLDSVLASLATATLQPREAPDHQDERWEQRNSSAL